MRRLRPGSAVVLGLILTACGGGGGGSGGGGALGSSGAGGNGTGAALSTSGSISAFGSIFVNGNHFNVASAAITIDDETATESDLRVGQSAVVRGTAAVGGALAMATSVEVRSRVVGAVASVDATASSFVVLGQTVIVNSNTSFDPAITPADIGGIRTADLVRVHGVAQADGSIVARRIDRATAAEGYKVQGVVGALNATTHTFRINALTVDYSSATLSNFTASGPASGDRVWVRGTSFAAATTTLAATRVTRIPDAPPGLAGTVEREGLVTRFASITDFDIAGQKITTNAGTVYRNGTATDVKLNAEIEARGTVDANGLLTAQVIEIHQHSVYALEAPIGTLTAGTPNALTVMGVTVTVDAYTRLEDLSPARIRNLAFGDLRAGDNVAVYGYEDPAGSGKLVARRLVRIGTTNATAIAGFFTATTAPQLKVLGVTVDATSATFYANRMTTLTSAQFFAQAAGRRVAVIGTGNAPLVATRVLLLLDDEDCPSLD